MAGDLRPLQIRNIFFTFALTFCGKPPSYYTKSCQLAWLIASICHYFPMNVTKPQKMKRNNKVKSTLRFAAFVFSPLLKWWWMTISRLKLLWPSCRPAFAQPAVKLSLKAVVKSCHSLNYDMMSWLHKRTIIWGSSYQDRAKRRGFMSALHPLTGAHLRIV